jgi:adenine-specific DNA-methyltransferase
MVSKARKERLITSLMSTPAYLTDQLIPYIGNKRKLLPLVGRAISKTGVSGGTFYDPFAGSSVVSRFAKTLGYSVISNDWEPYAYHIGRAYIECNRPPEFAALGGIEGAVNHLNSLTPQCGYIAGHYCPADDEHYNPDAERMFYTQENGRRIDVIREEIARWKESGRLSCEEESVLLSSLIFQCAYCSNTSGVFKGFHRGWGGATRTAWYRIRSRLTLSPPAFFDNGQQNRVYRADANALLDEVSCDIAYLDPPYNQHQYGANYHLLNTVALWDKPAISARFTVRDPVNGKAAIRSDWKTQRKSAYCYRNTAADSFNRLVMGLKARFILVSYSTDGIIPIDSLLEVLSERGNISVVRQRYKRYRVSSQRPSAASHNTEFVWVVDTGSRCSRASLENIKNVLGEECL